MESNTVENNQIRTHQGILEEDDTHPYNDGLAIGISYYLRNL